MILLIFTCRSTSSGSVTLICGLERHAALRKPSISVLEFSDLILSFVRPRFIACLRFHISSGSQHRSIDSRNFFVEYIISFSISKDLSIQLSSVGCNSSIRENSDQEKKGLAIGGFPKKLTSTLNVLQRLVIPVVSFSDVAKPFAHLFSKEIRIYVTPVNLFTIKFRGIFQSTIFTHTTSRESKKWLSGPDMRYWPRQSNFAFWFATTGWGISTEKLNIGAEQMKSFLMF